MHETLAEMALRHVTTSRRIVAAQRRRVEQLKTDGRDATASEALLARYERSLAIFEDDLKRIKEKRK
jgi:hypothetical protein